MNRRTFFKRVAVTCTAAVVAPVVVKGTEPVYHDTATSVIFESRRMDMRGIKREDLCNLIQATLKDMPPLMLENAFGRV